MRHEKPEALTEYERNVHESKVPQFCHNCINYTSDGFCETFDVEVPKEFTQEANDCDEWLMEPPF